MTTRHRPADAEFRQAGSGSWLDPISSKGLAARLSSRLAARCQGERGVVVTLTYKRDRYDSAQALYHAASDEQHVPLFLRRLQRRLNTNLRGRWFCKMEFQRGGWVHWHLVILGVDFIPHASLKAAWGHGHAWVERMTPESLTYITKYVAKPGGIPGWIHAQRPRSVKIIRVSPGFWERSHWETPPQPPDDDHHCPDDEYDEPDPPEPGEPTESVYEPIGSVIARRTRSIVFRDRYNNYAHFDCDLFTILAVLHQLGGTIVGKRDGWFRLGCSLDLVRKAWHLIHTEAVEATAPSGEGSQPHGAGGGAARLHLLFLYLTPRPRSLA